MRLEDFISFITELGFYKTWSNIEGQYKLDLDTHSKPNSNYMSFPNMINIHLFDEKRVNVSLSEFGGLVVRGENLLTFDLSEFKEEHKIILIHKILSKFKTPPIQIIKYLRDDKIINILKDNE